MNENPETQNRVPVAGLAVDACSERLAAAILSCSEHDAIRWHGQDSDGQYCWQYRDARDVAKMIDREIAPLRDEIDRLRGELQMAATNLSPDSAAYSRAASALSSQNDKMSNSGA